MKRDRAGTTAVSAAGAEGLLPRRDPQQPSIRAIASTSRTSGLAPIAPIHANRYASLQPRRTRTSRAKRFRYRVPRPE
jgi:hypothetical protein